MQFNSYIDNYIIHEGNIPEINNTKNIAWVCELSVASVRKLYIRNIKDFLMNSYST